MYVLAVSGEEVPDRVMLENIAGSPERVFYVENARDAQEAILAIVIATCGPIIPPGTHSPAVR